MSNTVLTFVYYDVKVRFLLQMHLVSGLKYDKIRIQIINFSYWYFAYS